MSHAKHQFFKNEAIEDIARVISQITGNQFNEKHKSMIEFRLQKRCLDLKIDNLENYYHFFKAHQANEVNYLVSLLTTHHTFFFREFLHFQYLEDKALPEIIPIIKQRADKKIRVWSAACSKGHEVYSLAMFLDFTLKQMAPDLSYHILGTDIDPESLAAAHNGVYTRRDIKEVPMNYLGNHWERGTGEVADYVKARSSLRNNLSFKQFNLLNTPENFSDKFDIIFCRNVFIYFDQNQIKKSSQELINHLEPHGYYIVGISESLSGLNLPLISKGPSIYTKLSVLKSNTSTTPTSASATTAKTPTLSSVTVPPPPPQVAADKKAPLRVLCVDDSPSILALLGKILSLEDGFEIVGTASNGLEAAEKVRTLKPDILTLDIHMPKQTGVEYLQTNFKAGHPPVVMVSSVSREESDLALQALHLGASDYVEKPALSNLREVSDEIHRKLRCAYRNQAQNQNNKSNLKLDDSFRRSSQITQPQNYLRVILAQLSDKARIQSLVKELGTNQPPTFILLDGAKDTLQGFAQGLNFKNKTINTWPTQALKPDEIYIADAKQFGNCFSPRVKEIPASLLVMGEISPQNKVILEKWKSAQILLEDLGPKINGHSPFRELKNDVVPVTSFAYMSIEFLSKHKK